MISKLIFPVFGIYKTVNFSLEAAMFSSNLDTFKNKVMKLVALK